MTSCLSLTVLMALLAPAAVVTAEHSKVRFPSPCYDLPASRTAHDGPGENDGGWELIEFTIDGETDDPSSGGRRKLEFHHNDDASTQQNLGFDFKFFGKIYNSVYINNNGNLSFDGPYSSYDPEGFPVQGYDMIAPFWGDVDTRSESEADHHGHVWMKRDVDGILALAWDHVGYYHFHGEKRNTFQVVISNGEFEGENDMGGVGNNVCFCYQDMEWTTGDASSGTQGFGGFPATVGVNQGNGRDFFQVGLFDKSGTDYNGPGAENGISWLNHKHFCFNLADSSGNTPPIPVQFPEDNTFSVCTNERLRAELLFLSPEMDQTTTVEITDSPSDMTIVKNDGASEVDIKIDWTPTVAGRYEMTFQATDSAGGVTTVPLTIEVEACAFIGGDPHFKSWNQKREAWHGECDLVMAHSETIDQGLDLHVRTEITENKRGQTYSQIQAAALRIGNDIIELDHNDKVYFNNVKVGVDELPLTFGEGDNKYTLQHPYPAKQINGSYPKSVDMAQYEGSKVYRVDLHEKSSYITFKTDKEFMSVTIHGREGSHLMDSVGLVGEYGTGAKLSREGQKMDSMHDHAMEWQVQSHEPKLFREVKGPQHPSEGCRMPETTVERRSLRAQNRKLLKMAAELCAENHPMDLDLCIDDILITGDISIIDTW